MRYYTIFFAVPFDSATRNLYDNVIWILREHYPDIKADIGSREVAPSNTYPEIATFKAQNRELNDQFKSKIQNADIVVADLTNNNPNVNFELGIALMQNKNILRVTGRSLTELGFDIRNLEVYIYKNATDLARTILEYLKVFFEIKKLEKSEASSNPLLYRENHTIKLLDAPPRPSELVPIYKPFLDFMLRDGKVRVDFEILEAESEDDWFGIYFRAGLNPFAGSHLVYIRKNGNIEVAVYYPQFRVLTPKKSLPRPVTGRQSITVEFDNNYLKVQMDEVLLETPELTYEEVGDLLLATYHAKANVYSVEMICRDTIEHD